MGYFLIKMTEDKKLVGLVDDTIDIRMIGRTLLTKEGYKVLEGKTGRDAVELSTKYNLAVLVLDNSMPEMTGLQALQEIRKTNKDLPILMVSADDIESIAREYGAEFLEKPYENKNLIAKVKELTK